MEYNFRALEEGLPVRKYTLWTHTTLGEGTEVVAGVSVFVPSIGVCLFCFSLTLRWWERVASHSGVYMSRSLWYIPSLCLVKLCFHFWFIYLVPFDAIPQLRLHALLLFDSVVMKVRKMCLEQSLWPVCFFPHFFLYIYIHYLFLQRRRFDQVSATVPAWSLAPSWAVWGPCWGCMRRLLLDWNIVSFPPGVSEGMWFHTLWADTEVVSCMEVETFSKLLWHVAIYSHSVFTLFLYEGSSLKHFKDLAEFLVGGQEGGVEHVAPAASTATPAALPYSSVV